LYEGPGEFRTRFQVPASWEGRLVWLRFEGVNYHSRVWINGELAGGNDDGFLPFEFDVSRDFEFGEENSLVVYVDGRGGTAG
jgi:beta-galactosidase